MKTKISRFFLATAVALVVAVNAVGGLQCFYGGQIGEMRVHMEKMCGAGDNLCKFQNTTMGGVILRVSKGCDMAEGQKAAVRQILTYIPNYIFLDASSHLYARVCPSRRIDGPSVRNMFFFYQKWTVFFIKIIGVVQLGHC